MTFFLQMDGIDDKLSTPSLTFDEVVIVFYPEFKSGVQQRYMDIGYQWINRQSNGVDDWTTIYKEVYLNGVSIVRGSSSVPDKTKSTMRIKTDAMKTSTIMFFSYALNSQFLQGRIYDVKVLRQGALVAHYDMSTKTVQDQTGNGYHGIITGATWVDDKDNEGVGNEGTEVSTPFALKQSIRANRVSSFNSKQNIFKGERVNYQGKIDIHKLLSINNTLRISIFKVSSENISARQRVFVNLFGVNNTQQSLFKFSSVDYNVLLDMYSRSVEIVESFPLKIKLFKENHSNFLTNQELHRSRQSILLTRQLHYKENSFDYSLLMMLFDNGMQRVDEYSLMLKVYQSRTTNALLKQNLYKELKQINAAIKQVLYKENTERPLMKQIMYQAGRTDLALKQLLTKSVHDDFGSIQHILKEYKEFRQMVEFTFNINTEDSLNFSIVTAKDIDFEI